MDETTVCANISPKGRRRRMLLGVVGLGVAVAWFVVARRDQTGGAWDAWKVFGFFPVLYGWLCILQASVNTCVVLAAKGTREVDGGVEPVAEEAVAKALRRRANSVWLKTALATVATTALLWLLR